MGARKPSKDQPASFSWTPDNLAWCEGQIGKYPEGRQASCVIPFLWQGQKQEGWISIPMMEAIATQLSMPFIRVYEVATFYSMFNLAPVGEYFVQICGTTPCALRGSLALNAVCERRIGEQGHVSSDGKFSWLEVECLGACVNAPMVQISTSASDHYYEDLSAEGLESILDALKAGASPRPGSQNPRRTTSDPEGEPTSLTSAALYDGSAARPIAELPNARPMSPAE